MAQDITIMGASYPDVPAVELPKTGGGTATFTDTSDTTADSSKVMSGEVFYDSGGNRSTGTLGAATDSTLGLVKTSSSDGIVLNASDQLEVNGRLGQIANGTGMYAPKSISPNAVGNGSLLLTEASNTKLGDKSLAVVTGQDLTCSSAAAGSTSFTISNTYENRIKAFCAIGGAVALNEANAANAVNVTSVTVNGSPSWTPGDSASGSIVIKTASSPNPVSSTTSIRVYPAQLGFSNLAVGQSVKTEAGYGASVAVGQGITNKGNASCLIGASLYNAGNGATLLGRQHINNKGRAFIAGTGHNTTNGPTEDLVALGAWSDVGSTTAFALGNGSSANARSNLFEIKKDGTAYLNGNDVAVITDAELTALETLLGIE